MALVLSVKFKYKSDPRKQFICYQGLFDETLFGTMNLLIHCTFQREGLKKQGFGFSKWKKRVSNTSRTARALTSEIQRLADDGVRVNEYRTAIGYLSGKCLSVFVTYRWITLGLIIRLIQLN